MAVVILPDAQYDLLSLQEYMLDQWGEIEWLSLTILLARCRPLLYLAQHQAS